MKTLAERIRLAARRRGVEQADFVRALGVSSATVSNWFTGEIKSLKDQNLLGVAAFLRVSPDWLQGRDKRTPAWDDEANVLHAPPISPDVPLISWVAAGAWTEMADPGDGAQEWIACAAGHGRRTFALRVKGVSMFNPGARLSFSEGDVIFVDPDRDVINGSLVVVRLDDDKEATFKRLLIDGEKRYLEALNPSWPNRIIPINRNATLIGVVIGRFDSFV